MKDFVQYVIINNTFNYLMTVYTTKTSRFVHLDGGEKNIKSCSTTVRALLLCFNVSDRVAAVIVHAMKSQPCILNEDARSMPLRGGKERHYRDANYV